MSKSFISWLQPENGGHWLEAGCGTGALTSVIQEYCCPASVIACDPSESFIDCAEERFTDKRISFVVADAHHVPTRKEGFDAIVAGLVLNFVPQPEEALASWRRHLSSGGFIAAYVWDYAEGMEFLRFFWDEAVGLDSSAKDLDEGRRFPLCRPEPLLSLFRGAGLERVETTSLVIATHFADFEDYWQPFLGGTGPAPAYVASLNENQRESLRKRLRERLHTGTDGSIKLQARAWAVRGFLSRLGNKALDDVSSR